MIIDKSTIDTLLCGNNAYLSVARLMKECYRLLKMGGIYVAISYVEPKYRLIHFYRSHVKFEISF